MSQVNYCGHHTTSQVKPNNYLKCIILLFLVISRLVDQKIPATEKIVGDLELVSALKCSLCKPEDSNLDQGPHVNS